VDQSTALQLAADEQEERAIRYRPIEILDYEPSAPHTNVLCPEGSVTVFLSWEGAPILEKIRHAASGERGSDVELAQQIIKRFEGRHRISYYRAWRLLRKAPAFASVRYGGRTLGTNLFPPPGPDLVALECPYNGGRLSPSELTLAEHRRDDAEIGLEAVALRHVPLLTEAEASALQRVPEDQLELNLAVRADCCDNLTDYIQVIVAVTYAMACMRATPGDIVEHISESELERLGPSQSARRLLEIRRDLLGHQHA
jgi:hypothetical protein